MHYYEDGNVALSTTKPISLSLSNISAESIMAKIGGAERDHQEELNRAFSRLAEGAFKSLRRQLPITRQKVEWERVGGYRLGQDISGGKGRWYLAPSVSWMVVLSLIECTWCLVEHISLYSWTFVRWYDPCLVLRAGSQRYPITTISRICSHGIYSTHLPPLPWKW